MCTEGAAPRKITGLRICSQPFGRGRNVGRLDRATSPDRRLDAATLCAWALFERVGDPRHRQVCPVLDLDPVLGPAAAITPIAALHFHDPVFTPCDQTTKISTFGAHLVCTGNDFSVFLACGRSIAVSETCDEVVYRLRALIRSVLLQAV